MEKQLHILFLSSWYPTPEQPFLGNFIKRHAELIAGKHMVSVVHLMPVKAGIEPQISEHTSGNLREIFVQYHAGSNPFSKWRNARKAFKYALSGINDIDLIHGNVILPKGLQFVWAKQYFNKPLIVSEHASYYREEVSKNWSWKEKLTFRKVAKAADCVTAVSSFLKREMQVHLPGEEIQILPNVVDGSVFSYQPRSKQEITNFVHVSTLDERYKNVQGIIAACQLLKESHGTVFRMQIISDESYEALQSQVKSMKLDDCVTFSGPMQPAEIAKEMQQSDALVLFSNYETFSIVVAESWATGTPVISTPVGIAKNLDPETGIQVETGNTKSLKNAMQQFVEGKANFNAQKIRLHAQKYFAQEVLETIEKLYSSLNH